MFVYQNKRFNIHAYTTNTFTDEDGVQHPGSLLLDPEFRLVHGITEIPDPARGDDDLQYTQEIDVDPWVIITDKSPAQIHEILVHRLSTAVQNHLDQGAQAQGYDNMVSACSYAGSPNSFQAEALSFLDWRAACWDHAHQVLHDVEQSLRTTPTVAELIAELPARVLP